MLFFFCAFLAFVDHTVWKTVFWFVAVLEAVAAAAVPATGQWAKQKNGWKVKCSSNTQLVSWRAHNCVCVFGGRQTGCSGGGSIKLCKWQHLSAPEIKKRKKKKRTSRKELRLWFLLPLLFFRPSNHRTVGRHWMTDWLNEQLHPPLHLLLSNCFNLHLLAVEKVAADWLTDQWPPSKGGKTEMSISDKSSDADRRNSMCTIRCQFLFLFIGVIYQLA